MSFGFSPTDILTVIEIATKAYQGWKHACGEYGDVTGNLEALCIVLERVKEEATRPQSILTRSAQDHKQLQEILNGCLPVLHELEKIRGKFSSLSLGNNKASNWDRIRFGNKNLDGLRTKLTQHAGMLTAYLTVVGLGSQSRIEENINSIPDQLQKILEELSLLNGAKKREEAALKHVQMLYRKRTVNIDISHDAGRHAPNVHIVPVTNGSARLPSPATDSARIPSPATNSARIPSPATNSARIPPLPTGSAGITSPRTGSERTAPQPTGSLGQAVDYDQESHFTQGIDVEFDEDKNIPPYMDWKNNFDRSGLLTMALPYRDLDSRDNGVPSFTGHEIF